MKVELIYKGWFGICPVYLSDVDADDAPLVYERLAIFLPLMLISEFLYGICFIAMDFMKMEPVGWPLKITAKLDKPIEVEIPDGATP